MSQVSRERNLHFCSHLQSLGIIDEDQFNIILDKCAKSDEKQTLFQISNYFANFTASDWFDLTSRLYHNWQRLPNQSQDTPYSSIPHQNPAQLAQKSEQTQGQIRKNNSQQDVSSSENLKRSQNNTKQWEASQKQQRGVEQEDSQYQTPSKSGNTSSRRREEQTRQEGNVNGKGSQRTASYGESKRSVSPNSINENKTVTPRKTPTPTRTHNKQQSSSNLANSVEGDTYNRLYNDFFQKRATMEFKREIKKSAELDNCTFVPQVNPVDQENHTLVSSLRVPVYDRLLQAKQVPANVFLEKHEYRELKGATFQPDISKSQRNINKWNASQMLGSPEDRKREATDRLYEDAQIKEKILFIKQMSEKDKEFDGCTFSPKILSPQKDKDSLKRDLTKSVDRLYDENLKRHRKLLKKEVESREQEMEECTFAPERPAKNYRSKESELDDLDVHDRLYERFKKKQQDTEINYASNQSQKKGGSARANSALLEKVSRSPNSRGFVTENPELNTPAFDRLYRDMIKRKTKMGELQEKFDKEDGLTFKPKTNNARKNKRSGSGTNRSHQDIRFNSLYDSKYSEGGLLHETPYDNKRESDQQFYASTMGFTYDKAGYNSNRRGVKN
jgi:hypothetical protein